MEFSRYIKQINKSSKILVGGLTLSAIYGRFTGPRVLVNSVPKAGTNLLQEIVQLLPLMRGRVTRTLTLRNGSEWLVKELSNVKKGQCVPAHISYDAAVDKAIRESGIRHVLIIRDFRDVILSNIQYLQGLHESHPHNNYFDQLSSFDEKIQACLHGVPEAGMMAWPDLIRCYRDWMSSEEILIVRYENLVSQDGKVAEAAIYRIAEYLGVGADINASEIRIKMFNPRGLTFNAPGIEKWKKGFNQHQIAELNQALGEELNFFGYEI